MRRIVILGLAGATIALSLMPGAAWAQRPSGSEGYDWGPHMMWWGGGWHTMLFGPLFTILFLAIAVAVTVLLVRWLGGPWHGTSRTDTDPPGRAALDILKERFARGEIDKDEYEARRRVLGE